MSCLDCIQGGGLAPLPGTPPVSSATVDPVTTATASSSSTTETTTDTVDLGGLLERVKDCPFCWILIALLVLILLNDGGGA